MGFYGSNDPTNSVKALKEEMWGVPLYLPCWYTNLYSFPTLVQRILKYGNIRITSLTPDKELNMLTYGMPFYVIMLHTKKVPIFGPDCMIS